MKSEIRGMDRGGNSAVMKFSVEQFCFRTPLLLLGLYKDRSVNSVPAHTAHLRVASVRSR